MITRISKLLGLFLGLLLMVGFLAAPAPTLADAPTVAVVPASGPAGSDFGYAAVGLQAGASYGLTLSDEAGNVFATATVVTDENGQFSGTFTVNTPGIRTLTLVGNDGSISVNFTVTVAAVAVTSAETQSGSDVGYGGVGFAANTTYIFRIADEAGTLTTDATVTTNDAGEFNGVITTSGAGVRTVTVLTASGTLLATTTYTFLP